MENHSSFRNRSYQNSASQANASVSSVNDLLYPKANKADTKKSLQEGLESLRRGKWLIVSIFLLVLAGTAAYTFTLPPEYEAQSLLLVSPQQSSGASPVIDLGLLDGSGFTDKNLSNQVLILQQSLLIAERTAERLLDMRKVPSTGEPLPILETGDEENPEPTITGLALKLQNHAVSIKLADEKTDGIWIATTSSSPDEAALIANLYAEEYVKRTRETSRERITASRLFLEQQIAKRREQLLDYEDKIKNYKTREGAVALDEASQYTITQIAQLEASLDEARIDKSMREASLQSLQQELQRIQPRLAERVASGVESDIRQTQQRIADLELKVEQIYIQNPNLRNNSSGNQDLQNFLSQIEQLKYRVSELAQKYVQEMIASGGSNPLNEGVGVPRVVQLQQQIAEEQIAISGAEAKINALQQRLSEYDQKLRAIPAQATQLAQLERGRNGAEQLYISLVEKLQGALLAEESELGFGQVIRPALVPSDPVRPRVIVNILIGAIFGLVLGVMAALARHKLDTRVYTPEDIRQSNIYMLGVIPDMTPMIKEEFDKKPKVLFGEREVSTTLASLLTPFSPVSEAYRRLYTSLQFSSPGLVIQTVMVTSPEAQAGKSTTALNLAITAARTGRRTLIVDADLRRPVLKDYLETPAHPELIELLSQDSDLDVERFATGIDNIYAITADEPVASPAELLGSKAMRDFIEKARQAFDLIIFDTPPVLVATDAVLLSTQCDATIMVTSSGGTDVDALRQTIEELNNAGAKIAGTVLNRFNPTQMFGYKYTYGYRYGYNKYNYGYKYQKEGAK